MKPLLTIPLLLLCLNLFSQNSTNKYYKDYNRFKPTTEKKAKFKEVTTLLEDGTNKVEFFRVKDNHRFTVSKFKNGKPIGTWRTFNDDGSVKYIRDFSLLRYANESNKCKSNYELGEADTSGLVKPVYGTSEADLFKFLGQTIRYPSESKDSGSQGVVYVQFTIVEDGSIEDILIKKSVDPYIDLEAVRVVSAMKKWTPGTKDGEVVKVCYNLPLRFTLK